MVWLCVVLDFKVLTFQPAQTIAKAVSLGFNLLIKRQLGICSFTVSIVVLTKMPKNPILKIREVSATRSGSLEEDPEPILYGV